MPFFIHVWQFRSKEISQLIGRWTYGLKSNWSLSDLSVISSELKEQSSKFNYEQNSISPIPKGTGPDGGVV